MYLSTLTLHNFRIYGTNPDGTGTAIPFSSRFNLIVGENDSGKSCIIDAIHLVLFDESHGWLRVVEDDFYEKSNALSIECVFRDISESEAGRLLEWLSFDDKGEYILKVTLRAERRPNGSIFSETRAGADPEGAPLSKYAREYLCATYLKPLRDAERELSPGKRSRLAQILSTHPDLAVKDGLEHPLVKVMADANAVIKNYFEDEGQAGNGVYRQLSGNIVDLRRKQSQLTPTITLNTPLLRSIYEKLSVRFSDGNHRAGLGSHNILFIAVELLLLKHETEWLKLALIEELEAHLDPQAQLRVVQFLEEESQRDLQLIVSTHSPILASVIDLEGLIICREGKVFPMGSTSTRLDASDYTFLRRFLDATKANLFFAAGVIMVEGPSEMILLPTLCKILTGNTLAKSGISLVDVGGVALLRYARIFHRQDGSSIGIPVACVTDRDVPPKKAKDLKLVSAKRVTSDKWTAKKEQKRLATLARIKSVDVEVFRSPEWTLEYDLARSSLGQLQHQAIKLAVATHRKTRPLSDKIRETIIRDAGEEYSEWQESLDAEELACKVYQPLALERASKVAAAEFFSTLLDERYRESPDELKQSIAEDTYIKYLVEAIHHVTADPAKESS